MHCQDPPTYLVNSLQAFLKPGALAKLNAMTDKVQEMCQALLVTGTGGRVKGKDSTPSPKKGKQSAKQKAADLSQKLVVDMVKAIEQEQMLNEGIYAENLKFPASCSEDNIVPDQRLIFSFNIFFLSFLILHLHLPYRCSKLPPL